MNDTNFKAIFIEKDGEGQTVNLKTINDNQLMEGDVTIAVRYSTLNYKDALAITGRAPIAKIYPLIPGVDFVGEVIESKTNEFEVGNKVILNGWGCGEKHHGGLAEKARVSKDWLIPLPSGMAPARAMAIGTAGYTSMLCVSALQNHGITPDKGPIIVTGAAGGVGSIAVILLAQLGYDVTAATGRTEEEPFLKSLGANTIIHRDEINQKAKPLAKAKWAGAIDTVGSNILANVLSQMQYDGVVTACGLAQGMDLPTTVAPFILRGVTLAGIESAVKPKNERINAWKQLAKLLSMEMIDSITEYATLSDAIKRAEGFFNGNVRGRIVIDMNP